MQTRQEYDKWLLQFTTHYICTKWLGRGRYARAYFKNLVDAKSYKQKQIQNDPNVKMVVYAITEPKERLYPVEVPIA